MKLDMDGKAGVVTGAAGGIGLSIAEALVKARAEVLLVDRREDVEDAAQRLNAQAHVADLSEDGTPGRWWSELWRSGAASTFSSTLRGFRLGDQR